MTGLKSGSQRLALIVAAGMLTLSSTAVLAEHPEDTVGPAPTANITGDRLILNNSVTGRQVSLTLSANAQDQDCHREEGQAPALVVDGANNGIAAYEWVVPADICAAPPGNTTGATVSFTTANNAGVSGTVEIRLRDNGTHKQDWNALTVADTQDIELVDPDEFLAHTVNVTTAYAIDFSEVQVGSNTTFQLRYQGNDLPWVGDIQKGFSRRAAAYNVNPEALAPAAAGDPTWTTVGAANQDGRVTFFDQCGFHQNPNGLGPDEPVTFKVNCLTPRPDAGRFNVHAYRRHLSNVESGNTEFGTPKSSRHWVERSTINLPVGHRDVAN